MTPTTLWRSSSRLLLAALVAAAGCGGQDTPDTPCELPCGDHGTCVIRGGTESCLCDVGYEGEACDGCGDGFVIQGSACVADPCSPNPCQAPHQAACTVTETGHACSCDADAQDHDGDGSCRPTCDLAVLGSGAQECDDSSGEALFVGTRTCTSTISYDPASSGAVGTIHVRGEWNGWDLSQPLTEQANGRLAVTVTLAAGDYAYKLYDATRDAWLLDPGDPYFKYVDGERNSRLIVDDCDLPLLRLVHQPESEGGAVTFKVQYVDGATGAGLGASGVRVTRNGATVSAAYDAATGVVTIADTGLAAGKYAYRFEAADADGRSARRLYVPVWVQERAFDWRDAVLYFAMTDRFANGDPANDAPVAGTDARLNWQGGDFAGLRQKLESGYFDALGVNAIWVSSISHNAQGAFAGDFGSATAYHSYWPISTGWTNDNELAGVSPVDPHFGTLQEFQAFVQAAHARGIRVLVDFVANHVHEQAPLWQLHQSADPPWFNLPAVGCEESNWEQPITCWFDGYLPDLDHRQVPVAETVVEHALWIVEETDIDGFRLDAVKHMVDDFPLTLRGRLAERLRFSGAHFYMVGETFTGEDGADLLKHYIGPTQLDGQFDFPLYWQVLATLIREERDLRSLEAMVAWDDTTYGDFAVMSTFLGNHDVCRALSHADGKFADMWCNDGKAQGWNDPPGLPGSSGPFDRLRLAWTFLMTSPGIPLIYYGDELGMAGGGDPDNRRFMTWDGLSSEQQATLAHVQALTAVRAAHPALRRGTRRTLVLSSDGLLWAYARASADDVAIVVINRAADARTQVIDVGALQLADGAVLADALGGPALTVADGAVTVELGGHKSAVLVVR